jgi:hypothetical protein
MQPRKRAGQRLKRAPTTAMIRGKAAGATAMIRGKAAGATETRGKAAGATETPKGAGATETRGKAAGATETPKGAGTAVQRVRDNLLPYLYEYRTQQARSIFGASQTDGERSRLSSLQRLAMILTHVWAGSWACRARRCPFPSRAVLSSKHLRACELMDQLHCKTL